MKLLQGDFMQVWLDFAIVVTGVMVFQLMMFLASEPRHSCGDANPVPDWLDAILFPIGYRLYSLWASLVEKVRMLS